MTDERMALIELLQKSENGDFLRSITEAVLQLLMEVDVEGLIGAARHKILFQNCLQRQLGFETAGVLTKLALQCSFEQIGK